MATQKRAFRVQAKASFEGIMRTTVMATNEQEAINKAVLGMEQSAHLFPFESHGPVERLTITHLGNVPDSVEVSC